MTGFQKRNDGDCRQDPHAQNQVRRPLQSPRDLPLQLQVLPVHLEDLEITAIPQSGLEHHPPQESDLGLACVKIQ
jgi:hypothetical protein